MKNVKMIVAVALIMGIAQVASAQDTSQISARDQLRIAVQEICPISGAKLGSMGTPVKVQVGQETVFLCCKGCLKEKINPTHWATIHANIARAQDKCPVMGGKLGTNPKWTVANGQIVYICCPPCAQKIAADPETYLKKVDELYSASLKEE